MFTEEELGTDQSLMRMTSLQLPTSREAYAQFLELMGYSVRMTSTCVWFEVRPHIFQAAPPFRFCADHGFEVRQVLDNTGAWACRWFSQAKNGDADSRVFLVRPPYDLSQLLPKARNQTRRGLERVKVRHAIFDDELAGQARKVYLDNVQRLELFRTEDDALNRWAHWNRALRQASCAEFWGAWKEDKLLAFSVVIRSPWGTEIVCQRSLRECLELYPNNALVFTIVSEAFKCGELLVSFGLSEYGKDEGGLDHFKEGMAFESIGLKEHYDFVSMVSPFKRFLTPKRLRQCYRLFTKC